jgi:hypothetical protein
MNRPVSLVLALALLAAACGSQDETASAAAESNLGDLTTTTSEVSMPPTIDAEDLRDAQSHVKLPQLVGLTEAEAREWAEASGFVDVVTADEEVPAVFVPWERVTLSLDSDGIVTAAAAG